MEPAKTLIVGKTRSGKTTFAKSYALRERKVIVWDWKGEYSGEPVTYQDIPSLFHRRSFSAVYRPRARFLENLPREFMGLVWLLMGWPAAKNFLFIIDEVSLVNPPYGKEGGMGMLLRYSAEKNVRLLYVTQSITGLPGVLISQATELRLFHLHGRGDQQVLRSYLSEDDVQRVATLPPYESVALQP